MDGLIRHSGIVRAIAAGQAQIAVATTGCSACGHGGNNGNNGGGCGIGKLAGKRNETLVTLPAAGLRVGQQVTLMLDETQLTQAALHGYLLPAVLLIAGALLGDELGADGTALAGALLGLLAGLLLTRLRRPLTPRLTQEPPHV